MSRVFTCFCFLFVLSLFISKSYGLGAGSFFGIDFGTDTFKVMILQGNAPEIVLNDQSGRKSDTLVGFTKDGERVFGSRAAQLRTKKPDRVISSPHQFLGRSYPDSFIENSRHLFPSNIVNNNGTYGFQIDDNIYSPEEVVGMIIEYASAMATESTNGNKFTDLVIVVPPYLTQSERQGYINSAKIAKLNVLVLANEGTSAAVQYLRSRLLGEENIEQHTIIYNVGASHSSATLTKFLFEKLGNGTITRKIIANNTKWGHVGGRDFDYRIREFVREKVEKEFDVDISNNGRVLARIDKESRKLKEILSANKEAHMRMESLLNDRDFSIKITREQFENMCSDLFDNVMAPINSILEETEIPLSDIDIEVIGGGSRVVKINEYLNNVFGEEKVGRHLNGDESSLQGACIFAATSSAGKVSSIIIKDTYNHEVSVEYDIEDVEPTILFKSTSRLRTHKNKNVFAIDDFNSVLSYTNADYLSSGISPIVATCDVTGFPDLSNYNLTDSPPTVKIKYDIDNRGLIVCTDATLRIEEYIITKKQKNITEPIEIITNTEDTNETNEEIKEEEDQDQENNDSETDNDSDEQIEEDIVEPEYEEIIETKKKYFELKLTRTGTPNEIESSQIYESRSLLYKLQKQDKERLLLAETKNELESFVYSTLDILENETVKQYATEDEIETFTNDLLAAGDWIYEDGKFAGLDECTEKLDSLKNQGARIQLRMTEKFTQPQAASEFHEWKESTLTILSTIVSDKMVDEDERDSLINDINETETWLEGKQAEQATKLLTDDPAWLSSELNNKLSTLQTSLKKLTRRRSRTPTPSPSPSTEEKEEIKEDNTFNGFDFDNIDFGTDEPIEININTQDVNQEEEQGENEKNVHEEL